MDPLKPLPPPKFTGYSKPRHGKTQQNNDGLQAKLNKVVGELSKLKTQQALTARSSAGLQSVGEIKHLKERVKLLENQRIDLQARSLTPDLRRDLRALLKKASVSEQEGASLTSFLDKLDEMDKPVNPNAVPT